MAFHISSRAVDRDRMPGLRLRAFVSITVIVVVAVMLTVAARATLSTRDEAMHDIVDRIEPARTYIYDLTHAMLVSESSPDPEAHAIGALSALLEDDPDLAERVEVLRRTVASWNAGQGDPRDVLEAAGSLRASLLAQQGEATERFADAQRRLHGLLWAGLLLSFLWLAVVYRSFRQWFGEPLGRISAAVDRVSAGDFNHRIPQVGSPGLRRLAQDVETMRARTVGLYEASQRAVEALAQQGAAVTSLRTELAPSRSDLPASAAFAAVLEPAEGVLAGDWYDCLDLGGGKVALAVVDVTGHGPQAGIFALRAKHLLGPAIDETASPGEALTWLARRMGDTGERFLSAFLAEVDTTTGVCRWANAGHPSAFVVGMDQVAELGQTGPILGPLPARWETEEFRICPSSTLVAYTDGLVEARSGRSEFGTERLFRVLRDRAGSDPAAVITAALREVRRFAGGRVHDDITVVALSVPGMAPVTDRRPQVAHPATSA